MAGPAESWRDREQLEAALIALDPTTGEVRAMSADGISRTAVSSRDAGASPAWFGVQAFILPRPSKRVLPRFLVTRLDDPIQTLQGAWIPEDNTLRGRR